MPRPPKAENANNPLRQLRGLLKDPVENGHISQMALVELCQIPLDTIRSIEAGRLKLSSTVLEKIATETGAHWDHEEARWTRFGKTEFSFSDFCNYRRRGLKRPTINKVLDKAIDESRVNLIHSKIKWLFENVPDESWERLHSRLNYFLEECKRDLQLTANDGLFYHPASLGSEDSAADQLVKPGQQKHGRAPTVRGPQGNVAGNRKRKRKYGL
jgi:hypothetical protein